MKQDRVYITALLHIRCIRQRVIYLTFFSLPRPATAATATTTATA